MYTHTQTDKQSPAKQYLLGEGESCHATVSLILCCLHYRFKSFQFRAIWRHELQRRHIRNRLIKVLKECTFH